MNFSRSAMTLSNLAAILDPASARHRDFIIQLSPNTHEELRITLGEARARHTTWPATSQTRHPNAAKQITIVTANNASHPSLPSNPNSQPQPRLVDHKPTQPSRAS